jgi:FLYWCH zinc finger domain
VFKKEAKYRDHIDWVCVKNVVQLHRCTARVAVNNDKKIKFSRSKHNHDPK